MFRAVMVRVVLLLVALSLGACASDERTGPNLGAARSYPGLNCAPFARELTGLVLRGDAADWWDEASGLYARASTPRVGGVLVFRRSGRLPHGHVSVVSRLLDDRHIHVIQANWVPGELDVDQLVVDISRYNDWSAVRVWYPPTNQMGIHNYATYGFVLPPWPLGHDALATRAEPAALAASGG
jgi:surface antigen